MVLAIALNHLKTITRQTEHLPTLQEQTNSDNEKSINQVLREELHLIGNHIQELISHS